MCRYWKKLHTCNHPSDRPYIEMCRPGLLSNTVCSGISDGLDLRRSHFPCYPCIKSEARAEVEAHAHAEKAAIIKANEARDRAFREKLAVDLRVKEERIRREACEKAAREREEEQRIKRQKDDEERKVKKEGGPWIETSHGKKGRGKKGGSTVGNSPVTPLASASVMRIATVPQDKKENNGREKISPKKERGIDPGGRAGVWGPKKILSRTENLSGAMDNGTNIAANLTAKD